MTIHAALPEHQRNPLMLEESLALFALTAIVGVEFLMLGMVSYTYSGLSTYGMGMICSSPVAFLIHSLWGGHDARHHERKMFEHLGFKVMVSLPIALHFLIFGLMVFGDHGSFGDRGSFSG